MPQTPIAFNLRNVATGAIGPGAADAQRTQMVSAGGASTLLNITASTVVKNLPGRICRVVVLVAGSAAGTINDLATAGGAAVANQVFTIPNTLGSYDVQMPCGVGIQVTPGTGQTVAVSYN